MDKTVYGVYRTDIKQTDLTIAEYDGIAKPGELVVDANPGPNAYTVYVANADGNLNPITGGGGGTIATSANYANYAGNVTGAAQPNITSLGNLIALTVGGPANLGDVGNVRINGGSNGQVLTTNGSGNLTWSNVSHLINGTSNVVVAPSGNVTVGVAGTPGALDIGSVGITTGNVIASSNITAGGNIITSADVRATGNANIGGNIVSGGTVQANNAFISNTLTSRTGPLLLQAIGTSNVVIQPGTGGLVDVSNTRIANLVNPTNDQDAATKAYVDSVAQGLRPKIPAKAATTAALAGTYNNGTSGVGATLVLSTPITTLDGVSLTAGDRILVKDQADPKQNGIYTYTNASTLTRATDSDTGAEFPQGTFVYVQSGTVNNKSGYSLVSAVTTVGTDNVEWSQIAGASSYTAGVGLTLTGSQFSIANTGVPNGSYGNGTTVPQFTVNDRGQITAVTPVNITANAELLTGTILNSGVVSSSLTSVGTLTGLTVNGVSNLGSVSNLVITGGTNGQYLQTNGSGNLVWAAAPQTNPAGNTTEIQFNNSGAFGADPALTFNNTTKMLGANNANIGNALTVGGAANVSGNVTGGNITTGGVVSATGNVSGGNITTGGQVVATGNVSGGNLVTSGLANVGTLTVAGVSNLGAVGNVIITGGSNGQVLTTNGSGNLSWTTISSETDHISNGTSNLYVENSGGNIVANVSGATVMNISDGAVDVTGQLNVTGGIGADTVSSNGDMFVGGNLAVTGKSNLGSNVSNVFIGGGSNGQVLATYGNGTLYWASAGGGTPNAIVNGNSNVSVAANGNVTVGVAGNANILTITGTGMNVAGTSNLGSNGNVKISGGSNGQFLATDGNGNLSWQPVSYKSGNIAVMETVITLDNLDVRGHSTGSFRSLQIKANSSNTMAAFWNGSYTIGNSYGNNVAIYGSTTGGSPFDTATWVDLTTQTLQVGGGGSFLVVPDFMATNAPAYKVEFMFMGGGQTAISINKLF